jgi:putative hydrolase of the HAD superfamily
MQKINQANTYLFDLDDTLYSPEIGILKQIEKRMHSFIARELALPLTEAGQLSNHYYKLYGGTIMGLEKHHNVCRDKFIHYCHDVDFSKLQPQPELMKSINQLNGRKMIYTNSPKHYATKILSKLSLGDCFDDIFSIEDADYVLKPHKTSYERICETHAIDSKNTVFFDDQLRNLKPAKALGMTTVWLTGSYQSRIEPDYKADYEADNLSQFFNRLEAS